MTNYEKWKADFGYKEPDKMSIICMNARKCEDCPIYKKFGVCDLEDNGAREREILAWLESEVEENG